MSLFLRYVAAIVIAFAVSMAIVVFGGFLLGVLGVTSSTPFSSLLGFLYGALPGFAGVSVGALCLPQSRRILGAVVLLVLGVSFGITIFMVVPPPQHRGFPRGIFVTAIGGVLGVALHYWRSRAINSVQPTAGRDAASGG